jgi:tRNA G18 (ribose-2'-O)-methylase SpoU
MNSQVMDRKLRTHEMNRLSTEEFHAKEKSAVSLLLDNVRSAHNVGSIFRTSDAFLINHLYLCGLSPTPPHPEMEKTALGATHTVEWTHFPRTELALSALKEKTIIGIEITERAVSLDQFQWPDGEIVLALGHEVNGLSSNTIHSCDHIVSIPQFGTKHSLNVAVSCAMVIWDYYIKKKKAG